MRKETSCPLRVGHAVWPWLLQIGWHRGGWYTARWIDLLLFPDNLASADRVHPELQDIRVGSFIPGGRRRPAAGSSSSR